MKILVAMSGGVDSSVAAKLLCAEGHECVGCTMKLYDNEDLGISNAHTCCSLDDIEDARSVSFGLGMKYYVFNLKDMFRETVIQPFIDAYTAGRTPNPCIECNRHLKFDKLFERAAILNCDAVATGHYARVEFENGKYVLKKALDESKDQSYVLYDVNQEKLSHLLLPLGTYRKTEARQIAEEANICTAHKHDSQDICFVPDHDYVAAMKRYGADEPQPGPMLDVDGNVVGQHAGIQFYTIGQRKRIGLTSAEPLYVVKILPEQNAVVVGPNSALFSCEAIIRNVTWISGEDPTAPVRCKAKIRYRHTEQWATVTPLGEGRVHLAFDEPQRAITPGQAAVFYDGDIVLGGGVIDKLP